MERGLTHLLELLLILHFSDLDLTSDYIVSVCDNDLLRVLLLLLLLLIAYILLAHFEVLKGHG